MCGARQKDQLQTSEQADAEADDACGLFTSRDVTAANQGPTPSTALDDKIRECHEHSYFRYKVDRTQSQTRSAKSDPVNFEKKYAQ